MERALIRAVRGRHGRGAGRPVAATSDAAVALAELPLTIRGFGPVKAANAEAAAKRRQELLAAFDAGPAGLASAAE